MRDDRDRTAMNIVFSILALVISILALSIAVAAFNRSGEDLNTVIENEVDKSAENVKLATARADARLRLISLRARVEAGEERDQVREEINEINTDLSNAYKEAGEEFNAEWNDINSAFEKLGESIRNETDDAADNLENLIDRLKG